LSDDLFEVLRTQRACREFRPDPVDDELLSKVLEAATFAPSAENRQPWQFVVVRDPATKAAIGTLNKKAWEGGGRAHSEGRLSAPLLADVDRGATGGIAQAPVIVVVGGDTASVDGRVLAASLFPAVQNMLLAACALGLGSALTTLPLVFADQLSGLVSFPPQIRPVAVVPIGWPRRALGPPRREEFHKKTHRDLFANPW
jgi:nitroreductase